MGIETADISEEKITELLEKKEVHSNTINEFIEVLKHSDLARYTPITNSEMKEEFKRAKEVIVQLDKQL